MNKKEILDAMRKHGEEMGWIQPKYEPKEDEPEPEDEERQKILDKIPY